MGRSRTRESTSFLIPRPLFTIKAVFCAADAVDLASLRATVRVLDVRFTRSPTRVRLFGGIVSPVGLLSGDESTVHGS